MKVFWTVALIVCVCAGTLFSVTGDDVEKEKADIKKVIEDAYVQAIFIKGDAAAVAAGWHPGCDIVTLSRDGRLGKMPAYEFVRGFQQGRPPFDKNARAEFRTIEVSGYAAVAVLELKSGDTPVYTDIMSLYKFVDGWKIVTKIFYSYPRPK
ncbi:MAG: nuclear transport factor 2 family protein [Acidobacteriota bacterium]